MARNVAVDIDDEIDLLKNEGLNISSSDSAYAKELLRTFDYNTIILLIRKSYLYDSITGKINRDANIYDVGDLCKFNLEVSMIILKYSLIIENTLKTNLTREIATNIGMFTQSNNDINTHGDFLNVSNYDQSDSKTFGTLRRMKSYITRPKKYQKKLIYAKNNNLNVRPNDLISELMFNDTICLYSALNVTRRKEVMLQSFFSVQAIEKESYKEQLFNNALSLILGVRNMSAHLTPLVSFKSSATIPMFHKMINVKEEFVILTTREHSNGFCKNDLFACIVSMCLLLKYEHAKQLIHDIFELLELFGKIPLILISYGFPEDSNERLLKLSVIVDEIYKGISGLY